MLQSPKVPGRKWVRRYFMMLPMFVWIIQCLIFALERGYVRCRHPRATRDQQVDF